MNPKVIIRLDHFKNKLNFGTKMTRSYLRHHLVKKYVDVYGGDMYDQDTPIFLKITLHEKAFVNSTLPRPLHHHAISSIDMLQLVRLVIDLLKNVAYHKESQVAEIRVSKRYSEKQALEIEVMEL